MGYPGVGGWGISGVGGWGSGVGIWGRPMASNVIEVILMPVVRVCAHCQQKNRVAARHLADTGKCGACKLPLPPMAATLAVDAALLDEIVQSSKVPILIDFWAAWCGPCRSAAPEVDRTAAEMAGKALVLKVDTEANPELSARFQVRGIPNFAVVSGGRTVFQQAGLVGHEQMEQWLRDAAVKEAAVS